MKKLFALLFAIFSLGASFAQIKYPVTKTVEESDTYFGITYKDPYRWLENFKDPEVVSWFNPTCSSSIKNQEKPVKNANFSG